MKLLMVRHGQSQWQVKGAAAGSDASLTPLGELQAHRLGEYLARHEKTATLFSSDLRRAKRTAEIVSGYLGLSPHYDRALREFDDWDMGWAPLPVSQWDPAPQAPLNPGYTRFRERVRDALSRVLESLEPGQTALIVAHGGTIGTALRLLLGSDTPKLWAYNAALHKVEWHNPRLGPSWTLHYLNNVEYLPPFMRTS